MAFAPLKVSSQENCAQTTQTTLYKDSIKCAFRVMDKKLLVEKETCDTIILDLGHGVQLQNVYELYFYYRTDKSSTVSISFLSASGWSKETTETIDETSGYKCYPVSVYTGISNQALSTVQKIKIIILSTSSVALEELEFRYIKPENKPVRGLTKEREHEINEKVKEYNRREEKASKRMERRKKKQLHAREGSPL